MSFGRGFQSGFQTADASFARHRQLKQAEEAMALNKADSDRRHALEMQRGERADRRLKEYIASGQDRRRLADIRNKRAEKTHAQNQEAGALSMQLARTGEDRAVKTHAANMELNRLETEHTQRERAIAEALPRIQAQWHQLDGGQKLDPQIYLDAQELNIAHHSPLYYDEDTRKRVLGLHAIAEKYTSGAPLTADDRQIFLSEMNKEYASQIKTGIGTLGSNGKKIVDKTIIDFSYIPNSPGGFTTTLRIDYEDGSHSNEPVTLYRSSAQGDNVAINNFEVIMNELTGKAILAKEIENNPQMANTLAQVRGIIFKSDSMSQGERTTTHKDVQLYMAMHPNATPQEAWTEVRKAKEDSRESTIMRIALEMQANDIGLNKPITEYIEQAEAAYEKVYGKSNSGGDDAGGASEGYMTEENINTLLKDNPVWDRKKAIAYLRWKQNRQ